MTAGRGPQVVDAQVDGAELAEAVQPLQRLSTTRFRFCKQLAQLDEFRLQPFCIPRAHAQQDFLSAGEFLQGGIGVLV